MIMFDVSDTSKPIVVMSAIVLYQNGLRSSICDASSGRPVQFVSSSWRTIAPCLCVCGDRTFGTNCIFVDTLSGLAPEAIVGLGAVRLIANSIESPVTVDIEAAAGSENRNNNDDAAESSSGNILNVNL